MVFLNVVFYFSFDETSLFFISMGFLNKGVKERKRMKELERKNYGGGWEVKSQRRHYFLCLYKVEGGKEGGRKGEKEGGSVGGHSSHSKCMKETGQLESVSYLSFYCVESYLKLIIYYSSTFSRTLIAVQFSKTSHFSLT